MRAVALLATVALFAGCAQIKARLPQRAPPKAKPPATAAAKPRPAPRTPVVAPLPAPEPAPAFVVLDPARMDAERQRALRDLAKADADALAADDVGYYLDVLQGRLRQVVGARGGVTRRGDDVVVDVSRGMAYAPGKAQLAGAGNLVAPLAKLLGEYRQLLVTVRVDPDSADAALAQARALALAQALADAGVARRRIVVVGTKGARRIAGPRVTLLLEPVVRPAPVRPAAR